MITYPQRGWQRIAVFEIDADAPIVDNLRGNAPDSHHLIIPARVSPPGLRWYELYVDFAIGDVQAIRLAQVQLQAVRTWATSGLMPGYRIVDSNSVMLAALLRNYLSSRSQPPVTFAVGLLLLLFQNLR